MVRSEQQTNDISNDIQALKDDLSRLRDDVSNIASLWMTRGRERLQDATGDLQERFQGSVENVTDWVKQRPIQTILIASVAGLILGKILRR
jgi:ElaB/YqjD/DUF883 family membrane-anchored ribosome-binding protein